LEDFLAPPLTVFFAGFLPAIFVVCMYVSVNNGVCVGGKRSEAFENLNVESSDFSTITKSVEKKQNRMDHSFFYARSFGAQNVTRGSNWRNE
jgi:hypothetical protein